MQFTFSLLYIKQYTFHAHYTILIFIFYNSVTQHKHEQGIITETCRYVAFFAHACTEYDYRPVYIGRRPMKQTVNLCLTLQRCGKEFNLSKIYFLCGAALPDVDIYTHTDKS